MKKLKERKMEMTERVAAPAPAPPSRKQQVEAMLEDRLSKLSSKKDKEQTITNKSKVKKTQAGTSKEQKTGKGQAKLKFWQFNFKKSNVMYNSI